MNVKTSLQEKNTLTDDSIFSITSITPYANFIDDYENFCEMQTEYNRQFNIYLERKASGKNPRKPACVFCKNPCGMIFEHPTDNTWIAKCSNTPPCQIRKIRRPGMIIDVRTQLQHIDDELDKIKAHMRMIQAEVTVIGKYTATDNREYEELRMKYAGLQKKRVDLLVFQSLIDYNTSKRDTQYRDKLREMRTLEEKIDEAMKTEKNVTRIYEIMQQKMVLMNQIGDIWLKNHLVTIVPLRESGPSDILNVHESMILWQQDMRQNRVKMWVSRNMKGTTFDNINDDHDHDDDQNNQSEEKKDGTTVKQEKDHELAKKSSKSKKSEKSEKNDESEDVKQVEPVDEPVAELNGGSGAIYQGPQDYVVGGADESQLPVIDFSFDNVGGVGQESEDFTISGGNRGDMNENAENNMGLIDFDLDLHNGGGDDIITEFTLE